MFTPLDMPTISAKTFQDETSYYLSRASFNQKPVHIISTPGDAVLLNGQVYDNLTETLLLLDIPGMREHLLEGCSIPIEECEDLPGNYRIIITPQAQKDKERISVLHILRESVDKLLLVLEDDPFRSSPPYAHLEGSLHECYSRMISRRHRLVYTIDYQRKIVKIISMWSVILDPTSKEGRFLSNYIDF